MENFKVVFVPQNKSVSVPHGTDLLSAAIKCGIILNAACGGEGLCGKCRCQVKKGRVKTDPSRLISSTERQEGFVLACQSLVESDLEVFVPKESTGAHEKLSHASEEFTKGVVLDREKSLQLSPMVKKYYVELPAAGQDAGMGELDCLIAEVGRKAKGLCVTTKLANIRHLADIIRESDYKVTAVVGHRDGSMNILAVEPGDTSKALFGFAFDIGTTTVVGQLIDLNTRQILGTRIAFNKQAVYGSDVITRIVYASEPEGFDKLNEAILDNIDEIIEELTSSCGVNLSDVYAVNCAGNMTMMHLLLKIDPTDIRKAPYMPATTVFPSVHLPEIGIEANPKGLVSFIPGVSTYIGGDIVAGVMACGLSEKEEITLLIDIGTNGEIVLGNREWMIGSAASAGPAFEGSGLSCGMKAVKGAINKVTIAKDLSVSFGTIGSDKPRGICGSGYIDILCQLQKNVIIDRSGKIDREIKNKRIRKGESNYEFVVVFKEEGSSGNDIVIQEDDIENLKRSKGAIYSAVMALLNKVEKTTADLKKIYIAGGFGNYLNIANSIFIGLLPDINTGVYEFIGNSSLAGARMALLSHEALEKTYDIYKKITYVDLGSEPNYMDEYVASLFFPHTDLERFPSVLSSR